MQTATLIQKYLAEIETGLSIGKPAGDENEGVVYSEKAMMHACVGGQIVSQQDKVILSTAYPEVAFVSDMEALQTFVMYAGYQLNDLVVSEGDGSRTFTLPNGASVVFDYARKMMAFSDYATFIAPNGSVPFNPYGNTFPAAMTLYRIEQSRAADTSAATPSSLPSITQRYPCCKRTAAFWFRCKPFAISL